MKSSKSKNLSPPLLNPCRLLPFLLLPSSPTADSCNHESTTVFRLRRTEVALARLATGASRFDILLLCSGSCCVVVTLLVPDDEDEDKDVEEEEDEEDV